MSELDDDQAPLPRLQPAPLQPRILAGVIDGVAIFALGLAVFLPPFLMGAAALPVWAFLAAILGWDDATRAAEVDSYVARVDAERASQARPDDAAADAVRTAAPEVRAHLAG